MRLLFPPLNGVGLEWLQFHIRWRWYGFRIGVGNLDGPELEGSRVFLSICRSYAVVPPPIGKVDKVRQWTGQHRKALYETPNNLS
jgi:hypothetical protein